MSLDCNCPLQKMESMIAEEFKLYVYLPNEINMEPGLY